MSMWHQLQSMRTEMNDLRRENQGLQASVTSMTTQANTPAPSLPTVAPGPMQPKKKLPDPARFSGVKVEFPNWRETVRSKLVVDGDYIGAEDIQTHYVLALLDGDAAIWASTWREDNKGTNRFVPERLLTHLAAGFEDRQLQQKAVRKLRTITQGNRSFASFLLEFDQSLIKAGAGNWDDKAKIAFLSQGLSPTLSDRLVAVEEPTKYRSYCDLLQSIDDKLRFNDHSRQRTTPRQRPLQQIFLTDGRDAGNPKEEAPLPTPAPSDASDMMDWTKTSTVRRARWVSEEELKARKKAGACLRCGIREHRIKDCRFLPPIRPTRAAAVDMKSTSEAEAEVMYTSMDGSDTVLKE